MLSRDRDQGRLTHDVQMPLSRAALCVATSLVLSALVALSFQSSRGAAHEIHGPEAEGALGVSWALEPTSVDELSASTSALVEVEVVSIEPGDPIGYAVADEYVTHPTERVNVRVDQVLEGTAPNELTLFKLGSGSDLYLEGDPTYRVGQTYLLFARPRMNDAGTALNADGTWLPVAPEGRLLEKPSGELHPFVETPVAETLEGKTIEEVDQRVDEVGQ